MDADEPRPRPDDVLVALATQDLDRLSLDELDARVAALDAEAARTRAKRASAGAFKSAAASLFKI
jgi:uncharacterized small protein (DUF1192 family)